MERPCEISEKSQGGEIRFGEILCEQFGRGNKVVCKFQGIRVGMVLNMWRGPKVDTE